MEKRITNTCVIKRTSTDPGVCVVHYLSESNQNYIWTFRRCQFREAFRSVTNYVAKAEGDLTYSDALVIHELIREVAGDDS